MNQDTTAEAAAQFRHQAAAPCHTCSSMAAAGMSARATMLKPRPPPRCRISSAPANTRPVTLMAAGEAVGETASESPMLAAGYGICCWSLSGGGGQGSRAAICALKLPIADSDQNMDQLLCTFAVHEIIGRSCCKDACYTDWPQARSNQHSAFPTGSAKSSLRLLGKV